jgi:putative ABC transport system permease protein
MLFLYRLRALFRRDVIADEIREELAFHIEMRIEELQRRGLSRSDAARQVHQRFGSVSKLRDQGYDVRGGGVMETIWQDVRHSVRLLRRKPAYAVATIATLSLGIGLIATLSSVVDAAWFRPLPFVQPDRLVDINLKFHGTVDEPRIVGPAVRDIEMLQAQSPAIEAIGGYHAFEDRLILDHGEPERVVVLNATVGYFETHGAVPVLGRTLAAADARQGAEPVVVLGYGFWRQRLGGDPDVVGKRLRMDNTWVTVVGVAPREFHRSAHAWRPMPAFGELAGRRGTGATTLARLRPGVSMEAAVETLEAAARTLPADEGSGPVQGVVVTPVYSELVESTRASVLLVGGGVLLLVVLVAVNVAGLVFAEGAARRQELAVRASLGAGRGRLVRQQMTDATIVGLVASMVGLVIAALSLESLLAILPVQFAPHVTPAIDLRTIGLTMVCGLGVAWLVAAGPAWTLSSINLREWIDGRIPDVRRRWFRRPGQFVVFAQVALAVVLLAGGGLLLRSLNQLLQVDLGFEPETIQVLEVMPIDPAPQVWASYYPSLVERLRGMPGVQAVGASDWLPMAAVQMIAAENPGGTPTPAPIGVTGGFLEAMGARLLEGRLLSAGDAHQPVAVLSQSAARAFFPSESALGRTVNLGMLPHTVVGTVADIRGNGPRSSPQEVAYTWLVPHSFMPPSVVLRTAGTGPSIAELRDAAGSIGPRVIVERLRPGTALLDDNVRVPRQRTALLSLLAALGLVLTLVGVAGVSAQAVLRRSREVAVRVAFGATPGQVVRTIAADTVRPALFGLAAGLMVSAYAAPLLERNLFQVAPTDPYTLAGVGAVVVIAATVVAWIPARRAARVDPVAALRQ